MKTNLYAVYDRTAQYFGAPFQSQNDESAVRMIKNTFSDPQSANSQYVKNPEDFSLYRICEFDDSVGSVVPIQDKIIDFTAFQSEQAEVVNINDAAGVLANEK